MPHSVVETRSAKIWLDDTGIIRLVSLGTSVEGIAAARENWEAVSQVSQRKVRPLFADIRKTKSIDLESRNFYSRLEVKDLISAVALLVASPFSRVIGSMFLGLYKLPVPIKLFTAEGQALDWLKEYLE